MKRRGSDTGEVANEPSTNQYDEKKPTALVILLCEEVKRTNTLKTSIDQSLEKNKKVTLVRNKTRKNCCPFCESLVTNFSRHIVKKYSDTEEVKNYLKILDEDLHTRKKKRSLISDNLRKKGNHLFNLKIVNKEVQGELLPMRRPPHNQYKVTSSSHVVCKYCLGLFKKQTLYMHVNTCDKNQYATNNHKINDDRAKYKNKALKEASEILLTEKTLSVGSENLRKKEDIIKHMVNDRVSQVAQSDPLILTFGSKSYDGGKVASQIREVISKMREMSKILILMKERHEEIKTFEHCFVPVYFNDIIDMVKTLKERADNDSGVYEKINIYRVGPSLNEFAYILKEMIDKTDFLLPKEKVIKHTLIDDFIELLRTKWKPEFGSNFDISSRMTDLQLSIVPNSDDVILVFRYITKLYETLIKKLKDNPTTDNYCVLAKRCIVQLAILNRRKPDEISHALLENYNEKNTVSRSDFSENCVQEFKVHGSSCENEFCLLTKPMIQAIDALISTRDQLKITSKYLFQQTNIIDNSKEEEVLNSEETVNEVRFNIRFLLKKPEHFTHNTVIYHGVDQMFLLKTIVTETHIDDVTMAFAFIAKSYELLIKELEAKPTPARYCVLAKRCIAHLIMLNRCKQTNVTEVLLEKYKQIKETMTDTSEKYIQVYQFHALGNNKTTLFLNDQMKMAIDTLVASRKPLQITSKYLFSQPNPSTDPKEEVFNGEEVINELGKTLTFQLKVPDSFTEAGLRYHNVEEERLLRFIVPCSKDISSLFIAITNAYDVLKKELNENPTAIKYSKLAKRCIAHLIILNKCEQTEVTRALLENYERIRKVSVCNDNVELFDFPGSENDSLTLLVSKQMKEAIDALVSSRNQLGIINKYLFALPNGNEEESVFSGEQAANSLKRVCTFELKQPFNFTVDALKNHNVNKDTFFTTSLIVDNETLSGNPMSKHANKTSSTENLLKKVNSTENTVNKSEITDVSVKNTGSIEQSILSENTEIRAEQSEGGNTLEHSQGSTFASTFTKFCLPDINSDSDSEDSACKTPIVRKRWSNEEKDVIYKYFGRHLLNLQNPGRQEISKMHQKEPVLKNRSLDQVNVYVNNIVTEQVKLTPPVVKRIKELCS